MQIILKPDQLEAFYHDEFVDDQLSDFRVLTSNVDAGGNVVDIGGGVGYFASRLAQETGLSTRLIDTDPASVERARSLGVDAEQGDALAPPIRGDEGVVCFNLILHHLVGRKEADNCRLQTAALRAWHGNCRYLFVNEYIYESPGNISGRLIHAVTSSRLLSMLGKAVSRIIPAFKANTFGVGVRFRANEEWKRLFADAGYRVTAESAGAPEPIAPPLRLLLIRTIRRDSFLLEPK